MSDWLNVVVLALTAPVADVNRTYAVLFSVMMLTMLGGMVVAIVILLGAAKRIFTERRVQARGQSSDEGRKQE